MADEQTNNAGGDVQQAETKPQEQAFDPGRFRAEIMAEFNRGLNAALKNLRNDILKRLEAGAQQQGGEQAESTQSGGEESKSDPRVRSLERKLADLMAKLEAEQKRREEAERKAEERERHAAIRSVLAQYQFANEAAREDAFRIFRDAVRRAEDGSLVGGEDELPLEQFIAEEMKRREYLLAPKPAAGAGASAGARRGGAPAITLDDIKPGMTKEQELAALAAIRQALGVSK